MKIIINESQLRLIVENEGEDDNLIDFTPFYKSGIPPVEWDEMYEHMNTKKKKGGKYDGYYINGDVYLPSSDITELNYLVKVGGLLVLDNSQIRLLPKLSYVGGRLDLYYSQIRLLPKLSYVKGWLDLRRSSIKTLPMLSYVGGDLSISNTPLSKTTTEKELREQINVGGYISL